MMPAAWGVSVNPTVVELRAATGTQTRGVFRVTNDTDQPVAITVELEPLAPTSYAPRRPDEWVQVTPTALSLAPNEQAEVAFVVSIPPETIGELAAEVVFVQSLGAGSPGGIQVRFGMALYASVAGTERLELEVGSVELRRGTPSTVRIPITNRGNVHCRPAGTVAISTTGGRLVTQGVLPLGFPAPPGRIERFSVALPPADLPDGSYRVSLDLTCACAAELPAKVVTEQQGTLTNDGRWIPERPQNP